MIDSHVGIDIAKAKFDVALLSSHKQSVLHRSFPNSDEGFQSFIHWLKAEQLALHPHFCMEATGRYGERLACFLHDAGFLVSVVNPSCIKNYARSKLRRTKTDKVDAAIIAEYCLKEAPATWAPLPKEARDLQQMSRELDYIKAYLQMKKVASNQEATLLPFTALWNHVFISLRLRFRN